MMVTKKALTIGQGPFLPNPWWNDLRQGRLMMEGRISTQVWQEQAPLGEAVC